MCAAKKKRRDKRRSVRKQLRRSQSAQTTPARIAQTERRLRNEIQRFAFQPQFRRDLDKAQFQFSGKRPSRLHPLVIEDDEIPGFQEWYIFDYPIEKGETLIDIFTREVGPRLRPKERDLLELWQRWNRFRLFEVQQVMPGTGVQVMDLLSAETLDVHDRSASNFLERWEIFLGRPLCTDRLHFTGTGIPLPPNKKAAVLEYSRALLADFQAQHPAASLDEFYKQHGVDIYRFMKSKASERPTWITAEGHPLAICTATYRIKDMDAVGRCLEAQEEFNLTGPSDQHPNAWHFVWLLRGRSHVPEQPKPEKEALVHEVLWFEDEDSPRYRNLGDVTLLSNRLELNCLSQARLEAGKSMLQTVLGHLIRHHRDEVETMEAYIARQPASTRPIEASDPEFAAMDQRLFAEQFEGWVDEPIEVLGGRTPREAVRDAEGRAQVIEILKMFEYTQGRRRKGGEKWYDVNQMRKELGLPKV